MDGLGKNANMNLLNGVHPIQSGVNIMAGQRSMVGSESLTGLSPFIIPMSMPPGQDMPQQIIIPPNAPFYNMIAPGLSGYEQANTIPVVDPRQVLISSIPRGVTQPVPTIITNTTIPSTCTSSHLSARLPVAPPIRPMSTVRTPSPPTSTSSPIPTFLFKNCVNPRNELSTEESISYPMSMSMENAHRNSQPQDIISVPSSPQKIISLDEDEDIIDGNSDEAEDSHAVVSGDITMKVVEDHKHKIDMTEGVLYEIKSDRYLCKRCHYSGGTYLKILQHLVAHLVGVIKCEICGKVFIKHSDKVGHMRMHERELGNQKKQASHTNTNDTDVVDKIARKNPGPHGSVSKNICSNTIWELPNSTIAFPSVSPFISPASGSKSSVHASTCHTTDHEILEIDDEEEMSQTDTPETGLMISNVVSLDGFTHGMENIPPACSKVVEPTNQTLQDHSAVPLTHSNTFVKIRGTFSLFRHKYFSERLFGYCRMCSLKCFSQKEMKAHLLSMHSLDIHYCDVRDYMMVKIFKLRCSFCPEHKRFSCSSPWQMNIHMRIAHSRLSFSKSSNEMNFHTEPKVKFPTKVSKTQPIVVQSMPLESQNGVLFPESSNQMNFPIERDNREISEPIVAASLPLDTYESPVLFPDSSNQMNFLIGRDNRKIVNPTEPKVKSSTRVSKTQPVVVQSMRLERESGVLFPKSSNQMNFAIQRDSCEISEPIVAESLPLDTYESRGFFPKSSNQMNFPIERDNRKTVKPNESTVRSLTRVSETQNVVFQSMGLERESGVLFPGLSNQVNCPIERDNREISERIVAESMSLDTNESRVLFFKSSDKMNFSIERDNSEIVNPAEPKVKSSTRVSRTQPTVVESMRLDRQSGVLFPKSSNEMNFPIIRDNCEIVNLTDHKVKSSTRVSKTEPIVVESMRLDTYENGVLTNTQVILGTDKLRDQTDPFQIDDFCDNIPQVSGKSDIEHFAAAIKDKAPVITKNKVSKEDIVDLEDENIDTDDSYGDFESLSNLPLRYRPFVELPKLGDCKKPSQKNTGNVKAVKKITKSKSDSRVSCLLCGISFESIFNLNRHVITHTKSDASVSCLRCGISFQSIVGLKSHLITHTKERPFVCILCNATFQTHQSLTMHTRRSHTKKSKWKYSTRNGCVTRNLANSICVPDNTQHNLFSYHNEKQTSDIILNNSDLIPNIDSDDDDDAWFDTSADYVCNINDITNNEKKAINEGIDSSNAINDTRIHNESHHYVPHNISVHEDDMVDKITLQSTGITNTNRIKNKNIISKEKGSIGNDIQSTKCSYCGISFKTVYHLKRHSVIHTNEGPFACTLCNASFQTYNSLNMHTKRIHKRKCTNTNSNGGTSKSSNDNTTSKDTKQKEGEKQSNIISKEKHTNKRAFACALCDTTFPNHQSLSVHKRWTHKYKRKQKHISGFRCIECSMSFKTVLHLNRHIITHTNKRSFACRICDATFQTHQSLSMHKRKIHVCNGKLEGKNSFSCSHCDKSFKSVLYLNRHMVTHTNKRPFVCTSCDTAFQTYQSLARHKRKVHNCKRNLSHINSNGGITRRLLGSITVYDSTAPDDSEPDRHHTPGDDMIEKIYLPSTSINDTKDLKKNVNSRDKFGQGSKCIYCGVFFRTAHHMKRHAVIHTNKGPFTCTLCCASFQTLNSLYMHKRRIHKIEYKRRNGKVATNDDITSKDTEQKGSKKQISIISEEKPATKSDGLNVVKRLTCIHCGMYFKSKLNLNRHAVIHTNKKPFACALCDATFPNHQSLSVHKRWTHKYKRKPEPISGFRCLQCSMSFKTVLHLNRHMITHSNKKSFACTLCDATFKTHQSRSMHKRNIHEFKRKWQCKNILTCNHCGKSFKSSLCLNRHLVTHTNERPFVCNVCTTTFQTYQSMARHKKMIHNSKKKVQCPNSNITLPKDKTISEEKIDIDKHVLNGNLKSFPCNHCAKSFKSILSLNRHFVTHTSERPFVCKLCDATFQTYQTLARHKRKIHRYQRKWQHTYTNVGKTNRFIGKINVYNLRTHMDYIPHGHHDHADDMIEKISSPPASINDTKYPKQFKSEKKVNSTDNNNLISKEKTDNIGSDGSNDDSGFPCIHCGIYFISEVNLNRHVVIHTNDRPFACALCDTTFQTHQSLSIHKRKIHNYKRKIYPYQNKQKRTKDFSCTHCGKSFKSVLCLNRHMVTHTNERPIVCRFCDTTFQTYQSLARHKRMIHRYQRKLQPTNINVDSTRSHVPDKGQENMLSDHNQSEEKQTSSVSLNNSNVTSLKDSNCKVDNDISCDPPVDVDNRPGNKEIHTHEAIESTSLRPHVEPIHEDDNIKKISLQSASITDTNDSNIIETDKKELSEVDISMNEVMKCGLSGAFL